MAKRKKQLQSARYTLLDCEIRPVRKTDKWCQRKLIKGQLPTGEAPWGYIVTIPYLPNLNTFLDDVDGYIVRSKKHCGKLLLQVVKKDYAPQYGINLFQDKRNMSAKRNGQTRKSFTEFWISGIYAILKAIGKKYRKHELQKFVFSYCIYCRHSKIIYTKNATLYCDISLHYFDIANMLYLLIN